MIHARFAVSVRACVKRLRFCLNCAVADYVQVLRLLVFSCSSTCIKACDSLHHACSDHHARKTHKDLRKQLVPKRVKPTKRARTPPLKVEGVGFQ